MPYGGGGLTKLKRHVSRGNMARLHNFYLAQQTNGTLTPYTGSDGGVIATIVGADNDNANVILNTGKAFKLIAGSRGWVKANLHTINAASKWDIHFGFTSGSASGTGVFSDTAATLASQDALMFYRLSDSAFWRSAQINAAAVDTDAVSAIAQATATDYYLYLYFEGRKAGLYAEFWVGTSAARATKIRTVTDKSYTNFDEMYLGFGLKATDTNASSLVLKSLTYDINCGTT